MSNYKNIISELIQENNYEGAISYLETYCKDSPFDSDAQFDLAFLLENTFVYGDGFLLSLDILTELIRREPQNINGILLKGFIEFVHMGEISEVTLRSINVCLKYPRQDIYFKQLYLLKAYYYMGKDLSVYIRYLKDSIEHDPEASNNYSELGRAYKNMGFFEESKLYYRKCLSNIKHVYSNQDEISPMDFDEYIAERFRGVHLTFINYNSLQKEAEEM